MNVATGLATVEPELHDVLRSLGAKKRDLIFKVGLPRSLPYFFASLKVAVTLAFVGSIISEIDRVERRNRDSDGPRGERFQDSARLRRARRNGRHGHCDVRGLRAR